MKTDAFGCRIYGTWRNNNCKACQYLGRYLVKCASNRRMGSLSYNSCWMNGCINGWTAMICSDLWCHTLVMGETQHQLELEMNTAPLAPLQVTASAETLLPGGRARIWGCPLSVKRLSVNKRMKPTRDFWNACSTQTSYIAPSLRHMWLFRCLFYHKGNWQKSRWVGIVHSGYPPAMRKFWVFLFT